MYSSIKELLVVMTLASLVFKYARPTALKFGSNDDFARRRNVWYALTAAAFLAPNFWIFALIAAPLLVRTSRADSNPVALYLLLLHVVPSVGIAIPLQGFNTLFEIDFYRLIAFFVLIPTSVRLFRSRQIKSRFNKIDVLLLAYGVLQLFLYVPPDVPVGNPFATDSTTNMMRRAFLYLVDIYILYFVVSRSCRSPQTIMEAQFAFCLSCFIMALVAVFESARHWILYANLINRWNPDVGMSFYLFRGGEIRSTASAGNTLALGYLLSVGFGFWLFLQQKVERRAMRIVGFCVLWLGLLAAYSRGPLLAAIVVFILYIAFRPRALSRLVKAVVLLAMIFCATLLTPLGDRLTQLVPHSGTSVDSENITYRQRLFARSWELFMDHPMLGDQHAYHEMEDLRQGQGIIDLVNSFASVAVFYGGIGLMLFLGPILLAFGNCFGAARQIMTTDPGLSDMGLCLCACTLGTFVMMATDSFGAGLEKTFYVLTALMAAYAWHLRLYRLSSDASVKNVERRPG